MPDLPPTPPSPPSPPPPEKGLEPLMPYDDLFGSEDRPPEKAPSLTFNVAAAPPPAPPAKPDTAPPPRTPGVVVSDDRPAYVPPRATDEPPEPLLQSPVAAARPPAFVPPPPPATISELLGQPDAPARREAPARAAPPPPPQVAPPVAPPRPQPPVVAATPARPAAPVRPPAPTPSRPMPLDDEADDYLRAASYDDEIPTQVMPIDRGEPNAMDLEADTVIAVAAPLPRSHEARPSLRLVGLLAIVLLALWMARLGAAPLFDVDEGAFSEATRELIHSHDWGSTTLNGVDRFDKPILVYWLQAISIETFGVTEFAARLPSALCAFFWCLALGQFAWRRFGPPVAIAAAGILATSLGPMLIGRAATADALLNLLLTLSTLDLWRHLENGRDAPRRRAFAFIGLGLLAKGPVAVLIPAAAAGLWLLAGRDRSRLLRLVDDTRAWALMVAIAAPWYAYALWRHGMAFVNGFLLHHNLDRFTGSLEGHTGSLFYYVELLPALMMPWAPLLWPLLRNLRARWKEPLGRFLLLWLAFVLVFFSLSGTKLPHYVLYGFTPLILLVAQELVTVGLGVRVALFLTTLALVVVGAASPWIAHHFAAQTSDGLYRTLLSTTPAAPWAWLAVPIGALVFAFTIWVPNVRHYLSEAEGALVAALLAAGWLVVAVMPWWGLTLQDPIRTLARMMPVTQMNLLDTQPLVQWRLHQPSIAYYLGQTVERRDPAGSDWALTRVDRLTPGDLAHLEIVQQVRGYALVRPATAASEPLSRVGAAQTAAAAASEAAYAAAQAQAAALRASEAAATALAASQAMAMHDGVAPAPAPAPAAPPRKAGPHGRTQP